MTRPGSGNRGLSNSESQVLKYILEGLSPRDIAVKLKNTEKTVNVLTWRISKKTGADSRKNLIHLINSGYVIFSEDLKEFERDQEFIESPKELLKGLKPEWGYQEFKKMLSKYLSFGKEDFQLIILMATYSTSIKNLSIALFTTEEHISERMKEILYALDIRKEDVFNWLIEKMTESGTQFNVMKCPSCGSARTKKNGILRGKQLYKCKECRKQFTRDI